MALESPQSLCRLHQEEQSLCVVCREEHLQQKLQQLEKQVQELSLQLDQERQSNLELQKELKHLREEPHSSVTEKCYDPTDCTLRFVEGEDDHDFLCVGYTSKSALMSCGHSVTPLSLTEWCQHQLDEGKTQLLCGNCDTVWSFGEVCKMALLTETERMSFVKKLFRNVGLKDKKTKTCPGCKSWVTRGDSSSLCVKCPQCSADTGRDVYFCWQCLREWKGPCTRIYRCENEGCTNEALETLSPVIQLDCL